MSIAFGRSGKDARVIHSTHSWLRMHLLVLAALLVPIGAAAAPAPSVQRQAPPVQTGAWTHSEAADWLPGSFTNTFVEGSVLRLQDGQTSGEYVSVPLQAPFGFNAGVAQWSATVAADQNLSIDVRSSIDGQTWDEWRPAVGAAQAQNRAISQVFSFRPFTSWLQYRVGFTGPNGSPTLDEISLSYIGSTTGPTLADIVGRVPLPGPTTLTPAPEAVARAEWAGTAASNATERQQPSRVEVAQIVAQVDDPNPLATLRAQRYVAQTILGQPELPYHYLIDGQGTIYEAFGSVSLRLPDAEAGTVRIGVLANIEAEGVSEAAQARLIEVLGWLTASYGIAQDAITAPDAAPQQFRDLVVDLRGRSQQAVIRSRTLFAAGSTVDTTERLALYNPGATDAFATLNAYTATGAERRSISVPAGRRVDVTLNSTLPEPTQLGVDVQADRQVLAERTLIAGRELLGSPGAVAPARTWYFGEATTLSGAETVLAVINPQRQEVAATLTIYPDGTTPVSRTTTFAPQRRTTLRLNDLAPDAQFGFKLVTSQPVVAERTVTLASGAAHLAAGVDELSRTWSFAEGSTTEGYTTTLHLLNPWPQQVAVSLQVMSEDGTSLRRRYAVPASARFVLTLNDVVPALPFSMAVEAERPIAAERIMQFDSGTGATAATGAPSLATRWTFVEGSTATPAEQFLLVANPNRSAAELDVSYVLADGTREQRSHTVPAMARLTIFANADVPDQPTITTIITADQPVVAERSLFVTGPNGRGAETSLGLPSD